MFYHGYNQITSKHLRVRSQFQQTPVDMNLVPLYRLSRGAQGLLFLTRRLFLGSQAAREAGICSFIHAYRRVVCLFVSFLVVYRLP